MAAYLIFFTTTASAAVDVEADSLEDAIELAYDELPGSLCHQCARTHEMSDEWDVGTAYRDGDELPREDVRAAS